MYLGKEAIEFVKNAFKNKSNESWAMLYDDNYDIKYSFYFGNDNSGACHIISPLTLFEYGHRVVTFSVEALYELCKIEVKENK